MHRWSSPVSVIRSSDVGQAKMSLHDRLGMTCFLLNDPRLWDAAASLHGSWVRLTLNWDAVQRDGPDRWEWEILDRAVQGACERELKVYGSLYGTPSWANAGSGRGAPPTSIVDWTRFVREIGLRYQPDSEHGTVHAWGCWNEYAGSVGNYVSLLFRPMRAVLKGIDEQTVVCGPELQTEGDWTTWFRAFLLTAGAEVDILTVHAYDTDGLAVWRKLTQARLWYQFWKKPSVKEVISNSGFLGKPCWLTETGFQSAVVGESQQATYCDQLLERLAGSSWPSGLLWFTFADEVNHTWGLCRADGSPKPAAEIFQRYCA
jgi:Glycosyl hydrolase catalytic core